MLYLNTVRSGFSNGCGAARAIILYTDDEWLLQGSAWLLYIVCKILFFFVMTEVVRVKNYAVHQSLEDPGSASQQSECNDPAPH